MPPKSKRTKKSSVSSVLTPTPTKEQREEMEKLVDKLAEEATARTAPTCNHRNMHYTAGELTCVLPLHHGGDHVGYVDGKSTAWSDVAGTPTRRHA